jgi:hypothetical protein
MRSILRAGFVAVVAAGALAATGCASHSSRIASFRQSWAAGDYDGAEQAVDQLLAAETGASPEVVTKTHGLDASVDASSGNAYLLLLEKAMARLAHLDARSCVKALLKARDELDRHYSASFKDYFASTLTDDESMAYAGADYEHILVRVMLAVNDLLVGEGDAYAYALQVGEKQEEIIGSDFGDPSTNYYPRRQYQRVAVGAYVQGILQEANLYPSEAALAYERGLQYAAGNAALKEALERARNGKYAPEGHGVLHVFYLGGRGPHLETDHRSPGGQALQIAAIGAAFVGGSVANLGQAAVPVPKVIVTDPVVPPLSIRVEGQAATASTIPILDVNQVACQQLEANMPGILARAAVRRAVKGTAGAVVENQGGDAGALLGLLFTAVATGVERAETRNWVSLPAQLQVARVTVPEGEHRVVFGERMEARVRIARGRDTYAVVLHPNLGLRGVVVVDVHSRVEEKPASPAAPPAAPAAGKGAETKPAPAKGTDLPPVPAPGGAGTPR